MLRQGPVVQYSINIKAKGYVKITSMHQSCYQEGSALTGCGTSGERRTRFYYVRIKFNGK